MTIERKNNHLNARFILRVLNERIVDTAKYRYAVAESIGYCTVARLPIDKLDTVAALTEWETVAVVRG